MGLKTYTRVSYHRLWRGEKNEKSCTSGPLI